MIATEDVLFVMPKDRELQFPAMAALQMYVNNYEIKMQANCVLPTMPTYKFRYWAEMSDDDWNLFQRLGIELKQQREQLTFPDTVIELNDERLLSFFNSEKHAAQVCSAIAGVETPPYPLVKQAHAGEWSGWLMCIGPYALSLSADNAPPDCFVSNLTSDELLTMPAHGNEITAAIVIGYQSWETYAAAAMGLSVIEILPKNKGANWLSKWKNPLYRVIEEDHLDRLPATLKNLKEVMKWRSSKALAEQASAIATAALG